MRQVIASAKHDTYERLQYIDCPVLILHGSNDLMIPSGNAHLMKRAMPQADIVILEGAGHGYNLEFQAEADALVFGFLDRVGAPAGNPTNAVR